ncbi:CPBP family intramembrane metalloprotease [bacterium]|nr:CPBP family intramembrane metalloprotease [bacterium]
MEVSPLKSHLREELGWQGYLLPRLQQRYSAFVCSIMIGIIWTFWHTPLFWRSPGL